MNEIIKSEAFPKPLKMANVPTDILFMMLAHLSVNELTRIRRASRFFHFLIVECNRIWEIQIKRLTPEQQAGIPITNFRKVIFGRHFLRSNLQKKLIPVVFSSPTLVATVGGLFSATKPPATRKPKYLLSQSAALKDIQVDLDKLTEALLSDNANLFISSASRLGVLTPYVAESVNNAELNTAMRALQRNGQAIVCGDVGFVAKLIDEILITKAINCFKLSLRLFFSMVDTNYTSGSGITKTYYETIVNSIFKFDDHSFKIEFFSILYAFGDNLSLNHTLGYLMAHHESELTKLFSNSKEMFLEVITNYFKSENCSSLANLTDLIFKSGDSFLKIKLFELAANSNDISKAKTILAQAISSWREQFAAFYQNNTALFLKIFAKYFTAFLDTKEIYDFIMALNLQERFIYEHLYALEVRNLNNLLTSKSNQLKPDREFLQKLQDEINEQFTRVNKLLTALEGFKEPPTSAHEEESLTVTSYSK